MRAPSWEVAPIRSRRGLPIVGLPMLGLDMPLWMLGERDAPNGTWMAGLPSLLIRKVGGREKGESPLMVRVARTRQKDTPLNRVYE